MRQGSVRVTRSGRSRSVGKSLTNVLLLAVYRTRSGNQFMRRVGCEEVAAGASTESCFHHRSSMLTYYKDFGVRDSLPYLPRDFQTIHIGKADVQHNDVGLKLSHFEQSFRAARRF